MSKIDYNRGLTKKIDPKSGVAVFMYKDQPGIFRNAHGDPVDDALAVRAGFDVSKLKVKRERQERIAKAMAEIEAELGVDEDGEPRVVAEAKGYRIVDIGLGRRVVEDPDGQRLNKTPMTEEEARVLFDSITADDDEEKPQKGKKAPQA